MRTIQQKIASAVYECVLDYQNSHGETDKQKYGAMAMKLPFLVQKAGLVQALAFVKMKTSPDSGQPFKDLLLHISQVVLGEEAVLGVKVAPGEEEKTFLRASRTNDLREYIYLTRRTMKVLEWFRRFSQSILKVKSAAAVDGS